MSLGPNDRFTVMPVPLKAPGCCFLCRSANQGPFVDTKVTDDWNGNVVYICFGCLHAIVDNHEDFIRVVEVPVEIMDEEVFDRAKSAIKDSIDGLLRTLVPSSVDPDDTGSSTHPVLDLEGLAEDSGRSEGSAVSTDSPSGQDSKPAKRGGRDRVSGNPSNEPVTFGLDL